MPTTTGRPRSSAWSRCSTEAKKASRSACRIDASGAATNIRSQPRSPPSTPCPANAHASDEAPAEERPSTAQAVHRVAGERKDGDVSEALRDAIDAAGGAIPFSEFQRLALYGADGFYIRPGE